jgi:hypothetical protein
MSMVDIMIASLAIIGAICGVVAWFESDQARDRWIIGAVVAIGLAGAMGFIAVIEPRAPQATAAIQN